MLVIDLNVQHLTCLRSFCVEHSGQLPPGLPRHPSPEQQLNMRWIGGYRELTSQDSFWWLSWGGLFNEEEQHQWNSLFNHTADEGTKERVGPFLKQSREREIAKAQV